MDILTSISLVIYPVEWSYRVSHIEIEFSNLLLRIEGPILFFDLWCLAASGGADICVSSTSFQKKLHRLASAASYRKGAKTQYDIS